MSTRENQPRPRVLQTNEPLPEMRQPGYYPGFNTMNQAPFWDEATRRTVEKRTEEPPPIRFFTAKQVQLMTCVLEHVLPQSDREPSRRIPLVNHLDERLYSGKISGFRYEGMPPDADAYRLAMRAFEAMAQEVYGCRFDECSYAQREELLESLNEGQPAGGNELWSQMPLKRFWTMLLHDAASAYYAHPWAWDEIGFGGPAYPRGYMRLERGEPEPWEVEERRYDWVAPEGARSDKKI
jgi:Gluconate 2-dehydrogenase subunit 3